MIYLIKHSIIRPKIMSDSQKKRKTIYATWQTKLLQLENYQHEEITLSEMEQMTGMERGNLSRTISRLVKGRREAVYNANDVYEAIKKKLEGENT